MLNNKIFDHNPPALHMKSKSRNLHNTQGVTVTKTLTLYKSKTMISFTN